MDCSVHLRVVCVCVCVGINKRSHSHARSSVWSLPLTTRGNQFDLYRKEEIVNSPRPDRCYYEGMQGTNIIMS